MRAIAHELFPTAHIARLRARALSAPSRYSSLSALAARELRGRIQLHSTAEANTRKSWVMHFALSCCIALCGNDVTTNVHPSDPWPLRGTRIALTLMQVK